MFALRTAASRIAQANNTMVMAKRTTVISGPPQNKISTIVSWKVRVFFIGFLSREGDQLIVFKGCNIKTILSFGRQSNAFVAFLKLWQLFELEMSAYKLLRKDSAVLRHRCRLYL